MVNDWLENARVCVQGGIRMKISLKGKNGEAEERLRADDKGRQLSEAPSRVQIIRILYDFRSRIDDADPRRR